jgi:hypothetical protein
MRSGLTREDSTIRRPVIVYRRNKKKPEGLNASKRTNRLTGDSNAVSVFTIQITDSEIQAGEWVCDPNYLQVNLVPPTASTSRYLVG